MKKTVLAFGLIIALLFTLFGCASETKEKDPIQEYIDRKQPEDNTFVGFGKEEAVSKDPLVICMDLEFAREPDREPNVILNDFLYTLDQSGGLTDVEIVYVPRHGPDRESQLDRIRIEVMSGGGPDVFVMNTYGTMSSMDAIGTPLIQYPEQAMENGLFLPLDEYMENHTRFTDWDKQTAAILAAGRNEEGQQVIPLTYTLPLLCFQKSDVDLDLTGKMYTWDDMLHDPEFSPYGRLMADCTTPHWEDEYGLGLVGDGFKYLEYALGRLADFENEELAFTEEELLQRVEEILEAYNAMSEASESFEEGSQGEWAHYSEWLGAGLVSDESDMEYGIKHEEPLTMVPLYSDDGGVTASILSWAAVNRNTDKPEEAYLVIDMLLSDHVQAGYWLYEELLADNFYFGIPLHEDILHPDQPLGRGYVWNLSEENYKEWCEVRSNITGANFQSPVGIELETLLENCIYGSRGVYGYEDFTTVEEAVHEAYEKMQRMVRE